MLRPLFVLVMLGMTQPALAGQSVPNEHVRSTNPRILSGIAERYARSPTFRGLVDDLERSDLILHIEYGTCTCQLAQACMVFVSASVAIRYVRSFVDLRQTQSHLIQQIGHELFHASEIAAAPEVRSAASLVRFHMGLGASSCRPRRCLETEASQKTELAVRAELFADDEGL